MGQKKESFYLYKLLCKSYVRTYIGKNILEGLLVPLVSDLLYGFFILFCFLCF